MNKEALNNILLRNSARSLEGPCPDQSVMKEVYKAALRAPDHAWLRPSRFIEVTGRGLHRLSEAFGKYAEENFSDLSDEKLSAYRNAPFRAPMVLILLSKIQLHPKVPEIEQMLSTAAAAQNILLALNAYGFGGMWRTGKLALNDRIGKYIGVSGDQRVLGYLYIGTSSGNPKNLPDIDPEEFVSKWS
jgi:nitroreductase